MDYDHVEILRRDCLGRVTVTPAQREAILEAFDRSGLKGVPFAKLVGVNYQTFASWVQKRRRARGCYPVLDAAPETQPVGSSVGGSRLNPNPVLDAAPVTQPVRPSTPSAVPEPSFGAAPAIEWIELSAPELVPAPMVPDGRAHSSSTRDAPPLSAADCGPPPSPPGVGLCISLPGGARMMIDHVGQAGIAAALLKALIS